MTTHVCSVRTRNTSYSTLKTRKYTPSCNPFIMCLSPSLSLFLSSIPIPLPGYHSYPHPSSFPLSLSLFLSSILIPLPVLHINPSSSPPSLSLFLSTTPSLLLLYSISMLSLTLGYFFSPITLLLRSHILIILFFSLLCLLGGTSQVRWTSVDCRSQWTLSFSHLNTQVTNYHDAHMRILTHTHTHTCSLFLFLRCT